MQKHSMLKDSISFQIWQINSRWQRELKGLLNHFNLTYREFILLSELGGDTPLPSAKQKAPARRTQVSKMIASRAFRNLESKGYVRRRPFFLDNRGLSLQISARGRQIIRQAGRAVEQADKRFSRVFRIK